MKSILIILDRIGLFCSYVAPEYACTGMLNEKSDIYSFGILIMELITGRNPVDYSRPQGEVKLININLVIFISILLSVLDCLVLLGKFG